MSSGLMVLLFAAGLVLAARVFLSGDRKPPVRPGDEQAARNAALFNHFHR